MFRKIKWIIARRKVLERANKIISQALGIKSYYQKIKHYNFICRAYRLSQIQRKVEK